MAKQTINTGQAANDKSGDTLRSAFTKTNSNFTEVYTNVGTLTTDLADLTNTVNGLGSSTEVPYLELTNEAFPSLMLNRAGWVHFIHNDNGSEVDIIDTGLSITRGVQRGIYNPQAEQQFNNNTRISPQGTEWNADGWYNLENVASRTFNTWNNAVRGNPPLSIGKELVMHDTINNKYYAVQFLTWSIGDYGGRGGFSYRRQLIDLTGYFVHTNYGTEVDIIDTGLSITRGINQGIYNPQLEQSYSNSSPAGTLWNADGWSDLSDVTTRTYQIWQDAVNGYPPASVGKELIMKDTANNKYYAIRFTNWAIGGQGGHGAFSYHRWRIQTNRVPEGILFPDGSSIKSGNAIRDIPETSHGIIPGGYSDLVLDSADRGKFVHFRGTGGNATVAIPSHYENPLPIGYTITLIMDEFGTNRIRVVVKDGNETTVIANGQNNFSALQWYCGGSGNAGIYTLMKIEPNRWFLAGPEIAAS